VQLFQDHQRIHFMESNQKQEKNLHSHPNTIGNSKDVNVFA